jgi:molybdopterin molybdotransferase
MPQDQAKAGKKAASASNGRIITRLTPLIEVIAIAGAGVTPVAPRTVDITAAAGRVLAADAHSLARPSTAIALSDGWAMNADETLGAGGYAPAVLVNPPQRVETGQAMPPDTDSVVPLEAVDVSTARAQVLAEIKPGEGVLPAGADCDATIPLRRAGEPMRLLDLAVFGAAGLARVRVREPRVKVLPARGDAIVLSAAQMVANDIERRGAAARLETGLDPEPAFAAGGADAIVVIGGTGRGRNDGSVQTLARAGEVAVHGVALKPGETAALGFVGRRPVRAAPAHDGPQ